MKHLVLSCLLHFYNKNNKTTNMHAFLIKYKIFTYFRKQRISKFGNLKFFLFRNISSLGIRMFRSVHIMKHNKVTRPAPLLLPKLIFGNTERIFAKTEELLWISFLWWLDQISVNSRIFFFLAKFQATMKVCFPHNNLFKWSF